MTTIDSLRYHKERIKDDTVLAVHTILASWHWISSPCCTQVVCISSARCREPYSESVSVHCTNASSPSKNINCNEVSFSLLCTMNTSQHKLYWQRLKTDLLTIQCLCCMSPILAASTNVLTHILTYTVCSHACILYSTVHGDKQWGYNW